RSWGLPPQRVHVSANWAPTGIGPHDRRGLRATWGVANNVVGLDSGHLGRVPARGPVLEPAALLRGDPPVPFLLGGAGAPRDALGAQVTARQLPNVQFRPPQPRAQLSATLAAGDLHLVTLRPGCEGAVWPSKFHGIVAAGRP